MKENDVQKMTENQRRVIIDCIKYIASLCDGAKDLDGMGFNKFDTYSGKYLATRESYSASEIVKSFLLCKKYKRQLPNDLRMQIDYLSETFNNDNQHKLSFKN